MNTRHLGILITASVLLGVAAMPSAARTDTDACTLLTPTQVGRAIGTAVAAGTHVTPTFVKTCTWTAPERIVTLYLQTVTAYDGGKQMATRMTAMGAGVKPVAVGDDAYYFVTKDQAELLVKHGGVAFKVSVYAKIPLEQKEAMELTLAKEALAKL